MKVLAGPRPKSDYEAQMWQQYNPGFQPVPLSSLWTESRAGAPPPKEQWRLWREHKLRKVNSKMGKKDRAEEFRLYMIAIVSYNLEIPRGSLGAALAAETARPQRAAQRKRRYCSKENRTREKEDENDQSKFQHQHRHILSYEEYRSLIVLSQRVRDLHYKFQLGQELSKDDYKSLGKLREVVIEPATAFGIDWAYALDLIDTVGDHMFHPSRIHLSLLQFWGTRSSAGRTEWQLEHDLTDSLEAHGKIIKELVRNEEVKLILGKGLRNWQHKYGVRGKYIARGENLHRDGFDNLAQACRYPGKAASLLFHKRRSLANGTATA